MMQARIDTRSALSDVSRLRRFIVAYRDDTRKEVARVIAAACLEVEAIAKSLCPVDTGRLRASIRAVLDRVATALEGAVETDLDYSAYVEFGTQHAAAQPYLIPALESVLPGFIRDLRAIYTR